MHAWPSHHRLSKPAPASGKYSNKSGFPQLDHGITEAATLVEKDGRLEWDSITCARPAQFRFRINKSIDVFPATKSPPLPKSTATVNHRADQGAHFLRTHFPEVDISADVIRSQITEDTLEATNLAQFDPFEGNILDIVINYDGSRHLVFPMGELGSELNLTPILAEDNAQTVIRPTTIPIRTFSTPIQQITSSPTPPPNTATRREVLLGVRTFGATSLLKFGSSSSPVEGLTDVTYFTSQDVGGASIIDFKISSVGAPFEVLLANKKGGLYGCSFTGGKKTMIKLHPGPESSTSMFWRVRLGQKPTECTILSGKTLDQLDFRTNQVDSLYAEPRSRDFLTSVEDYAQDSLIRLCSTSQIIWLDPRYPGRPLLGYEHHRQFDRTLHTDTFFFDGFPSTFLSTERNGLVSIYNVSRHNGYLIRADDLPYGILPSRAYCRYTGRAFMQHESQGITIFRTDEQEKVHCFQLQKVPVTDLELPEPLVVEQSDAVRELGKSIKTDLDKYGDQDKVVTDLYPAYDTIFRIHTEQQERLEEEQAEEFYDVMDRLLTFWQTSDVPSEHMLTSYDIAFRSHENLDISSRSDFTTGSLINSARGFRAVSQNKFPVESLRKGAHWHLDISDIQSCIDPSLDLSMGAQELAESLHSYDLIKNNDRTALSLRRENSAREQLAVDLVLSRDVYSPSAFVPPREVGNDLETMTEALSLGGHDADEPPEVEFGYLRPVMKAKNKDHYDRNSGYEGGDAEEQSESDGAGKVSLPMGVRLLLKDWEVGTKVKDHVFQDPYNTTGEAAPRPTAHPALAKFRLMSTAPTSQPIRSQRPPPILPSQLVAGGPGSASQPPFKRPPMTVQSQDTFIRPNTLFNTRTQQPPGMGLPQQSQVPQDFSQQSQQFMASTQILPGPHGGRPSVPKKKSAKKRLGGF